MNPKLADAWNNKGVALESLGKTKEANAAFAHPKELDIWGPVEDHYLNDGVHVQKIINTIPLHSYYECFCDKIGSRNLLALINAPGVCDISPLNAKK